MKMLIFKKKHLGKLLILFLYTGVQAWVNFFAPQEMLGLWGL
jgi:hypothetical protein